MCWYLLGTRTYYTLWTDEYLWDTEVKPAALDLLHEGTPVLKPPSHCQNALKPGTSPLGVSVLDCSRFTLMSMVCLHNKLYSARTSDRSQLTARPPVPPCYVSLPPSYTVQGPAAGHSWLHAHLYHLAMSVYHLAIQCKDWRPATADCTPTCTT